MNKKILSNKILYLLALNFFTQKFSQRSVKRNKTIFETQCQKVDIFSQFSHNSQL